MSVRQASSTAITGQERRIMNFAWIAGIALLVLIEKTLPWGRRVSKLTGAVLVVWGAVTLAMAA
jgi:predicted metal-binding membrane protein